ncbi:hypothetical protein K435DRAFT_268824 [Dendrothele bispora CBS 962.96]|uniref:Uncharacterized protein n=1 Tax=Dendrothele bispora (strain CBS 962.96) TaxID=1314807 RepID=A0A4S8MLF7_DENBC|nr:hypothetical protein K435DRAFT_268824 [Dendrothele bispora CBS 962.96]
MLHRRRWFCISVCRSLKAFKIHYSSGFCLLFSFNFFPSTLCPLTNEGSYLKTRFYFPYIRGPRSKLCSLYPVARKRDVICRTDIPLGI